MSTEHFLNSLRQGDYVDALDWPNFLLTKYSPNKPLDGDGLLSLAIYELINSPFSQSDLKFIEILYAFLNSFILPAEKAYAGTVIMSAAIQYYVYLEKGLLNFFKGSLIELRNFFKDKQLTNAEIIEAWMSRQNPIFNIEANNIYLAEKSLFFERKLPEYTKLMKEIEQGILLINHYQGLCLEYIQLLSNLPQEEKTVKVGMRIGIAQSLYDYLCQQLILKPAIKKEISLYLAKIRAEQEPSLIFKREEVYLKKLEDKHAFRRLYDNSKYFLGFFTKSVITTIFDFNVNEKSKKQNSKNSAP
ncbi:helical bundle domain-containing protein [Legionella sp. CNM-1927-20]|uniref:helical bundle domain-containing protein n=1 Tax=Legionella sp. CNM-1927-20 TaxID=3422221 RepID=UPI00403A9503